MAIINLGLFAAPGSLAKNQSDLVHEVTVKINASLQDKIGLLQYCFNVLWNNPNGMTPQQVLDAFGTDAGMLVDIMTGMGQAVNEMMPGALPLVSPFQLTTNADGTVTVGAAVTPPSS